MRQTLLSQRDTLRFREVAGRLLALGLLPLAQRGARVAAEDAVAAARVVAKRGQRDLDLLALLQAQADGRLDRYRIGRRRGL